MGAQTVWDLSMVPKRFRSIRWEALSAVDSKILETAQRYCSDFPDKFSPRFVNGLYLYSATPGNGKTAMAVAIVRDLIEHKKVARTATFLSMTDVIEIMHEARRQDIPLDAHSIGQRLFTSEILVLDDLGKGRLTDWTVNQYYQLFNRLYGEGRPVICTSNYSPSQLIKALNAAKEKSDYDPQFGHSVVSRICDMCERVAFRGGDYRIGQ